MNRYDIISKLIIPLHNRYETEFYASGICLLSKINENAFNTQITVVPDHHYIDRYIVNIKNLLTDFVNTLKIKVHPNDEIELILIEEQLF